MTQPIDAERLHALKYFLLDMDGTIYLGPNPIPGAPDFINYLRGSGREFLFFTNNPTRDAAQYSAKLKKMGIDAAPEDILTSGEATARYLVAKTDFRRLCVVGTESFENELRRAGLEVVEEDADAVVLAFDTTLTYEKLKRAALLLDAGLPYIATNPDKVCPTEYGAIPDCGATAALLEAATERSPKYIGKPNAEMAKMGMDKLGADPAHTAMVGDRLYTDMAMAQHADITAILVLSGEAKREDITEPAPDFIFDCVDDLRKALDG